MFHEPPEEQHFLHLTKAHNYPCQKEQPPWALVAQTCNPGYSGGRDQEDCGSNPAQANSSKDPISKNTQL
jgi:hypothetical protein